MCLWRTLSDFFPRKVIAGIWIVVATGLPVKAQIAFTEVSSLAGVSGDVYTTATQHGLGLNWIDYDKDGWPDLFLVNGFNSDAHLFHNDRDGTFTKVDELLPALPNVEMMGSVFADYDNDGDSDIYIFTDHEGGSIGPLAGPPNLLLKNLWVENGRMTVAGQPLFEEVASQAGVDDLLPAPLEDGPAFRSSTGGWLDFDRDGWVDLYVCHWMRKDEGDPGNKDRLYRNNGDGTFEDVTSSSGVNPGTDNTTYRPCLAFVGAHLDDDLWPDLYVVNVDAPLPYQRDMLFHNQADGSFLERILESPGVGDDSGAGMGATVADIDLDGDWDLYISDIYDIGADAGDTPLGNPLYLNTGTGPFFEDNTASEAGVTGDTSWGVNFFDADQDGFEDLFVATTESPLSDILYRNDGDGTFTDVSTAAGFSIIANGRGSAVADYDGDGDLDLAVVNSQGALHLYRNDSTNAGNWLKVKLTGTISNHDAIGALVKVTAGGQTLMRQVIGGSSAHSQNDLTLHFGLGSAATVDLIEVFWPSGQTHQLANVAANTALAVDENDSGAAGQCNGLVFTDVTTAAGINHTYLFPFVDINPMTGGAVAEDFDGDGWLDLYAVQGRGGPNLLYMNNGDGTFTEEAALRGADVEDRSVGASAADYDNDGDIDIGVSITEAQSTVLINDGSGFFTSSILLPEPLGPTMSSSWGDVDNDGLLELAIGQWTQNTQGLFLYKNMGGGVLSLYEFRSSPNTDVRVFSPRFADLNGDWLSDLYSVADFQNSQLYLNTGSGVFQNVTSTNGTGDNVGHNEMGHAIGDYDGDLDLDIFTSNILRPEDPATGNRLFNNNGAAIFTPVTNAAGVLDGNFGWGASFGDLDNDGDLDLYHVTGFPTNDLWIDQPARLFLNQGDGTFVDVAACSGADDRGQGKGALLFDYDNDGDLDIFIVNNRHQESADDPSEPGPPVLLRNETVNGNHWLQVILSGQPPLHRDGIGSRVYIRTGAEWQMRELHASTNFLAQDPGRIAHFGLGGANQVDSAIAEWVSGDATVVVDIPADQRISIPSPIATVSARQVAIAEEVTASAAGEANPVEWEIEGALYSDPAIVSFDTPGVKDLVLWVYDSGGTNVVRQEILWVEVLEESIPAINSPAPGTTLAGATVTFEWSANGAPVTDFQLQVGSAQGDSDLHDSGNLGAALSTTVSDLPTDGSPVFVRLLYTVDAVVDFVDYQYTAFTPSPGTPTITSPVPGSTLAGSIVTFEWTANGAAVTEWKLDLGSSQGAKDIYKSGSLGTALSTIVSDIPTDGSQVFARLFYRIDGSVEWSDFQYTAAGAPPPGTPEITAPPPGSTLAGSTVDFEWITNGAAVTDFQLQVGSTQGGSDLHDSGNLGAALSTTVSDLPTDGSPVFVRLLYTVDAVVDFVDYQYTAFTPSPGTPTITSPVPGSTLAGSIVTFEWTANGAAVTEWKLNIGSNKSAADIHRSGSLGTALSTTVSGIPTDGRRIYVRLFYRLDGKVVKVDFEYDAAVE